MDASENKERLVFSKRRFSEYEGRKKGIKIKCLNGHYSKLYKQLKEAGVEVSVPMIKGIYTIYKIYD